MKPVFRHEFVDVSFEPFLEEAGKRIFSLAAGDRIGALAPEIMKVGFGKILFGAQNLGVDPEGNKSFIHFLPDGTCSYNIERNRAGFSYGCILSYDLGSMIATSNSMPNGCGFTIFELENPIPDEKAEEYVIEVQKRIGQDAISELSRGNHFASWNKVLDPISGEDTNRRFVVVHCSGHQGVDRLYNTNWLSNEDGYHEIPTPHGSVVFLEDEAKNLYLKQFDETNQANTENRVKTMEEIFPDVNWKVLEHVTHQGLLEGGRQHIIGAQRHEKMVPMAFNPQEGLISFQIHENVKRKYHKILGWQAETLGLTKSLENLHTAPHGGGYEFRQPLRRATIHLDKKGIHNFQVDFSNKVSLGFQHFKQIREHMTFRRKNSIIREIHRADIGEVIFELPYVQQIYPVESIPGGN